MSWSTPADLKAQVTRRWERGELLRPLLTGEAVFPWRLTLRTPTSTDITEHFEAVRSWANELATLPHLRIEWREIRHRVQGTQRLPTAAWIDSADAAFGWLGKRRDAERFAQLLAITNQRQPAVLPWLGRRPMEALRLADAWPRLLNVIDWIATHPVPGIYLRQIDIPGIHTKFIEAHRGVLAECIDLVLPAATIVSEATGIAQFARRYGFREKPTRIRLRLLDPEQKLLPGTTCPDLALDADNFARLAPPVEQVFITENETNFLAFPTLHGAAVIFGAGYGWQALGRARWLADCTIHYWGDIDTHGFAILDQLRRHFPQVNSLLMDRETLMAHAPSWGEERDQLRHDLTCLNTDEQSLFDDLRDNRIRQNLRLEQELIGFDWLRRRLQAIAEAADYRLR